MENHSIESLLKLFEIWDKFDRTYFKFLQRWNLSYNSYLVFECLAKNPDGIPPAELADQLNIPRQTMTFVLDQLEKDELLARFPHPSDRRKKVVRLTEKGEKLSQELLAEISRRELLAMQSLTQEEMDTLTTLYNRLHISIAEAFSQ